jgi:hypothetical protein
MAEALTEAQKTFIENKVKELGTVEAVEAFYDLKDEVSSYAIAIAQGNPPEDKPKKSSKSAKTKKVKRRNLDEEEANEY